ncbi:hypothetical protein Tco_1294088 [Tanacetum coccineum]
MFNITPSSNSQVKDNKIDLLVQQYEQFVISEDESIDNAFARFNTIITSLKALDEGYSSKNYFKAKVEEEKSLALKAKKESSDEECLTSGSEDKEYAMAMRRPLSSAWKNVQNIPKDKKQRAFVGGSWSDSGDEDDEKVKDETCLVAHASIDLEPDEWIKDSGCSKHMTGNRKLFSTYKAYNGGNVIFGSNLRGNIIGKGQICDNKCKVTFSEHDSEITKNGKVIGDMRLIQSLASKELVRNLPRLKFDQHFYDACKVGKQAHASHKAKNSVSTTR